MSLLLLLLLPCHRASHGGRRGWPVQLLPGLPSLAAGLAGWPAWLHVASQSERHLKRVAWRGPGRGRRDFCNNYFLSHFFYINPKPCFIAPHHTGTGTLPSLKRKAPLHNSAFLSNWYAWILTLGPSRHLLRRLARGG